MKESTTNEGKFPKYNKDEYHCCRVMGEAHKTGEFSKLFDLIAEDCILKSQFKGFEPIEGKDAFIKHIIDKKKPKYCLYETVRLKRGIKRNPTMVRNDKDGNTIGIKIPYEEGKICTILTQFWDDEIGMRRRLIQIDTNDEGKIKEIFISIPEFFDYEDFILPTDYEEDDIFGTNWYPKYEDDNILNDQELQENALRVALGVLRHKKYNIFGGQRGLIGFPNFIAQHDGRLLYIAVRGVHVKDRLGERDKDGLFPFEVYSKNLMNPDQLEITKKVAKNAGAEYHYFIVYMRNEPEINDGLVRRGKWKYDLCRLEPGDF